MLISIVTVTFNNINGLKNTIQSIQNQTNKNFELIVIDGGSTDGSVHYLQENTSFFSYWISEKDRGIYHAMNKGIAQCKGTYIYFLNAGDTFYNKHVIEHFSALKPTAAIVYGHINVLLLRGTQKIKKMPAKLTLGTSLNFTITHQAIFHHKKVFETAKYDENYTLIADWIVYNEAIFLKNLSYQSIDVVIANYESGGLSSNVKLAEQERAQYIKSTFSPAFYELLQEHNQLRLRYAHLNNLFFVQWYLQIKKYLKQLLKK